MKWFLRQYKHSEFLSSWWHVKWAWNKDIGMLVHCYIVPQCFHIITHSSNTRENKWLHEYCAARRLQLPVYTTDYMRADLKYENRYRNVCTCINYDAVPSHSEGMSLYKSTEPAEGRQTAPSDDRTTSAPHKRLVSSRTPFLAVTPCLVRLMAVMSDGRSGAVCSGTGDSKQEGNGTPLHSVVNCDGCRSWGRW